jgi:beta-galactosidase GanA
MMRVVAALAALFLLAAATRPPKLERRGQSTQLIVDSKPFLMLGGELSNSAASSAAHMAPVWPKLRAAHLNTVLAPVSWQLIEPKEGQFNFASVDALLSGAQHNQLHLVLLWFGAWKNSTSSYTPSWVRRDEDRFPRVQLPDGKGEEILSAFSPEVLAADRKAFVALLRHLNAVDARAHTVLMVQVENEIGMLPTARDHSLLADRAYSAEVPTELTSHLAAHRATLVPASRERWEASGARTSGSWEQVFGTGPATEEIFTAWHYARYVEALARAGKGTYPLPMYANVALNRPGKAPGEYPSGGPLPHLIDVWKAGAPSLDLLAPDIYFRNFIDIVARYDRPDNALFIPEQGRASMGELTANALFAIGEHKALGYSPFAADELSSPDAASLDQVYAVLTALSPQIVQAQAAGRIRGAKPAVAFDGTVDVRPQKLDLGSYRFKVDFIDPWAPREKQKPEEHGVMVIQTGSEDYLVVGKGAVLTFEPLGDGLPIAGIDTSWEEVLQNGRLVRGRLLNGDETHQGRHIRLPPGEVTVQRVRLYRYR